MSLGEILRELREEKGLSQSQLAEKIGTNQQNISRWESNTNIPNLFECIKLADYYCVSFDTLIGRENYATGNVEIKGEILTGQEQQIISLYRSLDATQQNTALQILSAAFPNAKSKSKN